MIFPPNFDELCKQATVIWGQEAQEAVAIGEIGEFLTLIGRRAQGRDTREQWIDETTDLIIMSRQLAHLHGIKEVEKRLAEKVEKLTIRLDKYKCKACRGTGFFGDEGSSLPCITCLGRGHINKPLSASP